MSDTTTIKKARDQYGQSGLATAIISLYRLRGVIVPEPIDEIVGSISAFINHGRWIVECACLSAQLVDDADLRFYCVNCFNQQNDGQGKWLEVAWPTNATEIEDALLARPNMENRNWSPGESVEDLLAENAANLENGG